jgi:hypothetical protein
VQVSGNRTFPRQLSITTPALLLRRVNKAYWKTKNQYVALKTFQFPDLVPEELSDFKRELWLTRSSSLQQRTYTGAGRN